MRNSDSNTHGVAESDANAHRVAKCYTYCYCDSNGYSHTDGNAYVHANGDGYGYVHADAYSDANRSETVANAATASNNTAAASVVCRGKWTCLRRELARQTREFPILGSPGVIACDSDPVAAAAGVLAVKPRVPPASAYKGGSASPKTMRKAIDEGARMTAQRMDGAKSQAGNRRSFANALRTTRFTLHG